jgi:hypothetical protein
MKLKNKIYILTLTFSLPIFVNAQSIVNCGNDPKNQCNWSDFMKLFDTIMTTGFAYALLFSVFIVMLAGFNIMRSQGDPGKMKEARKMLVNVVVGALIILGSFMIVSEAIRLLGDFENSFLKNLLGK